jgi:hypothetical protein
MKQVTCEMGDVTTERTGLAEPDNPDSGATITGEWDLADFEGRGSDPTCHH